MVLIFVGVNAGVFGDLAASVDVTVNMLATALGLSPRTLRNRTKKPARLTADETERGFRVYRVLRRASDVLGDKEAAASWINTPQKALGDQTPLSLLVRDVGTEEVLNVLTAIRYGVYL
jgi:putative toxin-antitoxin system antitoxin component (TIGR02293 family)